MDDYITKPIQPVELFASMARHVTHVNAGRMG
jgi:DNA-binding response OmpR family regulator